MAAVTLLGLPSVSQHVDRYLEGFKIQDDAATNAAEDKLLKAMRERWSRG